MVARCLLPLLFLFSCVPPPAPKGKIDIAAPESMVYEDAPFQLHVGVAIGEPFLPTVVGGAPQLFVVTPTLPGGVELDSEAGTIGGTPLFASPKTVYTIVGSNGAGEVSCEIELEVIDDAAVIGPTGPTAIVVAPSGLAYPLPDASYVINTAIPTNTPSISGTPPFSFVSSPTLPAGLTLNPTTGVITGTPTALQARTPYAVMALNSSGMTETMINIEVLSAAVAPVLSDYTDDGAVYSVNVPIADNVPIVSGTPPFTYSLLDALPAGLTLAADGKITGTPTAIVALATYRVKVENSVGSSTFSLTLTVERTPPALTYPSAAITLGRGGTIDPLVPTVLGSPPFVFGVSGSVTGLTVNSDGTISGAPTTSGGPHTITVTATNAAGSDTFDIAITVTTLINYPVTSFQYISPGTAIPANDIVPTVAANHQPLTISPPIPSGLQFNTTNGRVSGAPNLLGGLAQTTFTVTFQSSTTPSLRGTSELALTLVNPLLPSEPTGPSGVTDANGVFIAANMAGAKDMPTCSSNIDPSIVTLTKGQSIGFKLMSKTDYTVQPWTEHVVPNGPGWPSLGCYLMANVGSTCVVGTNSTGSFPFIVRHVAGYCPQNGSLTVNP